MQWLTRKEICDKTRLGYMSIWRRIDAGTFPRGRKVGHRILWREDEVDAWMESQPRQRLKGDRAKLPASHANLKNVGKSKAA